MNHSKLIDNTRIGKQKFAQGAAETQVLDNFVILDGEAFYRINDNHNMPSFFMNLSSSGNHWMFLSSEGAVTAGRECPLGAFFPYYSADKLADLQHCSGPRTIVRLTAEDGSKSVWEPFSNWQSNPAVQRRLYKNSTGNKIVFEEVHSKLKLKFSYRWTFGSRFGFVRTCWLSNLGSQPQQLSVLDGFENILPAGLGDDFQNRFSNLADAYKKNELLTQSQLGIYYLNSIPSDRAEPSEGLRANVAWHYGVPAKNILISSDQIRSFQNEGIVVGESDLRGKRGAYLVHHVAELDPEQTVEWAIVGDAGLDTTDVRNLQHWLENESDPSAEVQLDVENCERKLDEILASADGLQLGSDSLVSTRHKANVLFNVMRGGVPVNNYVVDTEHFEKHLSQSNRDVADRQTSLWNQEPCPADGILIEDLRQRAAATGDVDLTRIANEYLPLTFSRRHGDPTRPWNRFSIKAFADDGSCTIDYQGNWRDIFQNWEALLLSWPEFSTSMVFRFVNASTADGYNPYRLTMSGFEWESPDPDDPWSNIGYWGDHQIVYLQKLLHWSRKFDPQSLDRWLNQKTCAYAEIPYRIRSYDQIQDSPKETIDFDFELEQKIESRVAEIGSDGKLCRNADDELVHVTLAEKLLLPALVKITNFVPGGGIWLNTQRPEWNDANNALVGHGMSMVTVCYLRRYFAFLKDWLEETPETTFEISEEVAGLLSKVTHLLLEHRKSIHDCGAELRKTIVDGLSQAGSDHRTALYQNGISGEFVAVTSSEFVGFAAVCLEYLDQTLLENRREDGLYHSYNLLAIEDDRLEIEPMFEMLEGQVAVLSSGLLTAAQALEVLQALRNSLMFREDQHSYMLYPDRELKRFVDRNWVDKNLLQSSALARDIVESDCEILRSDVAGDLHFSGQFRNVEDLNSALDQLAGDPDFAESVASERSILCDAFEKTFNHRQFIGRSTSFFGYEGLGSIYWHMVSKLCLATQECLVQAIESEASREVIEGLQFCYRDIRDGIAKTKSPQLYGAFPTDPYSHTPAHAGAQQPGMTGQVKEDILTRICELGVRIEDGCFSINPALFEFEELLAKPTSFDFVSVSGDHLSLELNAGSFAFTFCQVPVVYQRVTSESSVDDGTIEITLADQSTERFGDGVLSRERSQSLFLRRGEIQRIDFYTLGESSDS